MASNAALRETGWLPGARAASSAVLLVALALGTSQVSAATARVQYVSASSVYLDQGLAAGLTEGASVTVKRDGKEIARLTASFVAEHSAACRIESSVDAVRAGDTAIFSPVVVPDSFAVRTYAPDSSRAAPAAGRGRSGALTPATLWPGGGHVHGRLTSLYTKTKDPNGTYENPSVLGDLRWAGRGLEQTTLRLRATRPMMRAVSDLPGVVIRTSTLRVYEVAAGYRSPSGSLETEAGRFLPRQLEGIGYMDGVAIHWRSGGSVVLGMSGGRSTNLATAGLRSRGPQVGAYVEAGSRHAFSSRRWRAMIGAAFSGDSVLTRRQYLVERADVTSGDATFYQSVEVDLNPRWKRKYGEPTIGWTAWSLGSSFRMRRRVSFALSADSRRAVLVPEQAILTGPILLDTFIGAHASTSVALPHECALRLGGDARRRDRDKEIFTSWDAGLSANRIGMSALSGGLHAMGYGGDHLSGTNADANLTSRISSSSQIDVAGGWGGTRFEGGATASPSYRSRWLRAGIDYRTPGGLWAALAHEWRAGGPGNELSAALGLSF